jgi:hypothetical protein
MRMFHHVDGAAIVGLGMLAMMLGGLSVGAVIWIAREIALQRIRENYLRERIARHWATVNEATPPTAS